MKTLVTTQMLTLLGAFALAWFLFVSISHSHQLQMVVNAQRDDAAREQRAHELEAKGISVQHDADMAAAKAELEQEKQHSAAFAAELQRVQGQLNHWKILAVQQGTTGTFVVPPGPPAGSPRSPVVSGTPTLPGQASPPPVPVASVCRLAAGEQARIDTSQATLEEKSGVVALAATASLLNVSRGELVWAGPLRLTSMRIPPPPPPPPPSKGLGLRGQCVTGGCAAGLAGMWEPARHLSINFDVSFFGAAAARGGGASALLRW